MDWEQQATKSARRALVNYRWAKRSKLFGKIIGHAICWGRVTVEASAMLVFVVVMLFAIAAVGGTFAVTN